MSTSDRCASGIVREHADHAGPYQVRVDDVLGRVHRQPDHQRRGDRVPEPAARRWRQSSPFEAMTNGSTSLASVTVVVEGGVKVSTNSRFELCGISSCDGDSPTGRVTVAAMSG